MAFSFSGLTAYTKQNIKPLLTSAVFGAKTQDIIKQGGIVIPNVKSSVKLPLMDTDAIFQGDTTCSWDPSGTTTFSQRDIVVGKIKVEEALCPKDLEVYFTQEMLRQGSYFEDLGSPELIEAYLAKKNARIAAQLETAIWQGDTTSGNAALNKFDGLSKLIVAGTPVDANVLAYTGVAPIATITQSNVIAATEGIYKAIPVQVLAKGDTKIFVGNDWYRLLIMAYRAANLFAYNPQDSKSESFILPATNVEVVSVNGLNGTGDAFGLSVSNMALGVDLQDEEMNYKMWYSEDNNQIRFRASWKIGTNVAFTSECVKFVAAI
jgi:hypothetical protein